MDLAVITSSDTFIITIRLIIAALLGGLVGMEREYHHHPAGFRTHLLVSVGSCLIMLLAFYGFQTYISENPDVVNFDPSRLAAYVVSGIGFLGAGTILVQGYTVRGLTTAASIWVVAGIGLTVGAGMYGAAFITTFIVILSLLLLGKINFHLPMKDNKQYIVVLVEEENSKLHDIIRDIEECMVNVRSLKAEKQKVFNDKMMIEYRLLVEYEKQDNIVRVMERLQKHDFIQQIHMEGK
ncbi:putative Mg2+ transporter-C (MgtC) family protein [Evansella caseinilytica]|uniref:Putative Mg2+ transporter-C (MgtC) family protein n=1 Tax=Evansella caseinilytica TaxID=1503961 RepID=A0A1H3UIU8_9BACI|nr:MgtC/SapB family protein [Evansella caseinilytica]SDZ62256.1 putative Mg2+ transporter-C (MgtC) family protein [Evansella caseinilytica]